MLNFSFRLSTKVCFGIGMLNSAGAESSQFGRRPLVVVGGGSMQRSGMLDRLLGSLREAGCAPVILNGVEENPSVETADRGGALARERGCDVVLGLGGGSVIDAAKAVALTATNDGSAGSYLGSPKLERDPLPIIAIPTTAGSGSEVTANAVMSHNGGTAKTSIFHIALIPRVAVLDPETTLSMSPALTAYTGLDALCHAVEGYVCRAASPMTDLVALKAIDTVFRWLLMAHWEGNNVEARSQMLYASLLAGMVISNTRTTIVHNMSYPLTTTYGTHHGLASILLLPTALEVYRPAIKEKLARVERIITSESSANSSLASLDVIDRIRHLMRTLGIPPSLAHIGAKRQDLQGFAKAAAKNQRSLANTPVELTEQDVLNLYMKAYKSV